MASPLRLEKLNNLLREQLGEILDEETDTPSGEIITITRVAISPDVHYADVFISILGKDPGRALEILQKRVYYIQQELNRRIRMRPVPRIKFKIDEEELRREKVERSLAQLKRKGEI